MIDVFTVEGDLISRLETFDEADLDAALARFEELRPRHGDSKTRQPKWPNDFGPTSRPATGPQGRNYWPRTAPPTIAVGS